MTAFCKIRGSHCKRSSRTIRHNKEWRQFSECALDEQILSRAAFDYRLVVELMIEYFDHYLDCVVTLQLISSVFHGDRVDWGESEDLGSIEAIEQCRFRRQTINARRVEKCNGNNKVNSKNLNLYFEFVACNCLYTRANFVQLHACQFAQFVLTNHRLYHNARMTRGV